ncbi:DUF2274 domain-containing protein [Variovorax paradoxus]|uniref:DUF2274 domain-containing protein n=1 Tax=Variovorax paradoxus TaxID=34073 RepID=UPI003521D62F
MSGKLKAPLEAYAEVYSRLHGPVDALALVPRMLSAFIVMNRGFKALSRTGGPRHRDSSTLQLLSARAEEPEANGGRNRAGMIVAGCRSARCRIGFLAGLPLP